jgi:hypothetical protein
VKSRPRIPVSWGTGHFLSWYFEEHGPHPSANLQRHLYETALVKLYVRKNALFSYEMLIEKLLPFFEEHDVRLLRVLTDPGSEFCGNLQQHEYVLYLAPENINHTKTKANAFIAPCPWSLYQLAFRKNLYASLDELRSGQMD